MIENKIMVKAHDFPLVYRALGVNLSKLGCVMLDIDPEQFRHRNLIKDLSLNALYKSSNVERFWIDGFVAIKDPHLTLLYGLLEPARNFDWHIAQLLSGWKVPKIEVENIGHFDSPYADEQYYCVVGHVKLTPELLEGHQRLEMLPHINTFAGYKPHVTLAYVRHDMAIVEDMIQRLSPLVGEQYSVVKINLGDA